MPVVENPARVLIVDASEESRLLLAELLGRTGVEAFAAEGTAGGLDTLARLAHQVLVFDADGLSPREVGLLCAQASRYGTGALAVGTNRPDLPEGVAFVRKPYHYRALVHKIWASLGAARTPARAAA